MRKILLIVVLPYLLFSCSGLDGDSINSLIIDHTSVQDFDFLTLAQIEDAKKVLMIISGESHGRAYGYGLELLEAADSAYSSSTNWSGAAENYRTDALRWNRAYLDDATWASEMGEEDFWTNSAAKNDVITGLNTIASSYAGTIILGFGWCWDMTWLNGVTSEQDPLYGTGWAGSSVGGPDGNLPWGLDAQDGGITGNSLSLDDYLTTVTAYNKAVPDVITIFTTGPVDDDNGDGTYNSELGYQRWLKHEKIREFVRNNGGVLFDYADILSWDYTNNLRFTESWNGNTWNGINLAYDDLSYNGGQGESHITQEACIQLAKGLWVMAAKIAEWNNL